jgi:hypothetical protein
MPLSSVVNNTALHRLIISPNDTCHGRVIKTESNMLFDYTSMVSPMYLKPTQDGLQYDVLQHTLTWWQRCARSVMSDVSFCFSNGIFNKNFLENELSMWKE